MHHHFTPAEYLAFTAATMDVNLLGPVRLCRAVLPHMRQCGQGLIIHVTSVVGRVLSPACGLYCASKFALEAYAEVLHLELSGLAVEIGDRGTGPVPVTPARQQPGTGRSLARGGLWKHRPIREIFSDTFSKFFASEQSPNTQDVADAIAQLVATPAGKRPLRTVCGPDSGAVAINQYIAPIQAEVRRSIGMPAMAKRAHAAAMN